MYRSVVSRTAVVSVIIALAAGSSACFGFENIFSTPTSPSNSSSQRSYIGTWASQGLSTLPSPGTCGNLKWTVTSQQGNQIAGNFEATCNGGITLKGTANATVDETINWKATGDATEGSTPPCPFDLTGTGTFQGTSTILIKYEGTVCSIPVRGTEPIKR